MKIRTRLRVNAYISMGVIVVIFLSLAWSFREMDRASRNIDLADDLRKEAFERAVLRDDYLLNQEPRARVQWIAKSEALRALLDRADRQFSDDMDKELLEEARKDFEATFSSFSKIIENRERKKSVRDEGPMSAEAEKRQLGQVFLRAYALTDNIGRLHESAHRAAAAARSREVFIVLLVILASAITIIGNSAIVNRILTRRVTELGKGTEIIGGGNLDYRIEVEGDDELSDLARSSNEMAARLKESYTSNETLEQRVFERTAQLEAANKELEAFSYSVSHDLRAPLRHLAGFVELLNKRSPASQDEKSRHYLNVISDSAKQMGRLIDDLLSFSKMGRAEMMKTRVNLDALVIDAISTLQTEARGRDITWKIDSLPEVYGDPSMLRLVMTNLIHNALKFTRPRHPAIIEIGHISGGKDENIYHIRDNGVGFDMRYVDKLFGLFQRLHRTEEFEGTGLGLANVRRVILRHGGRTWAEGELDRGATFYFSLPKGRGDL